MFICIGPFLGFPLFRRHITSLRCLVRLVSRISSDASPVPRCAYGDHFWDLRWRKWCRLCRWPAPWVGLSDLCAHGCALSCQLPLTRHIGRAFDGLWKDDWRTVSESVRRVCYTRHSLPLGVFSLCTSRSLFTACACVGNYIGFGHGHLGLFLST
ncbi:hypothetical protein EDB89DRAFT_192901 [Lactarius sanguifluus]|nr:hypothetical protein EDB89DRAFT_192901 [Lactarius sanguifluus]